jgi:hypothetical protein
MISNVQIIDAMARARRDHEEWLKIKHEKLPEHVAQASAAGFDSGWRAAITYLKFQGALQTTDQRPV